MSYFMHMQFDWNPAKNQWLKENRGVTFEEIVCLLDEGYLRAILKHPNKPNQKILVVEREGYAYNVPFIVKPGGTYFLKTVYPSRASTQKYIGAIK